MSNILRTFGHALASTTICVALTSGAAAQDMPGMPGMSRDAMSHRASTCAATTLECATAVTPFFDAHDTLWIAWSAGGAVSVARSVDAGKRFSAPIVLGAYGTMLDTGADAHPQIVVDRAGRIVVAYGVFKDSRYNARVMVSTSRDGIGFTAPRSLSQDAGSQRFPVLAFDAKGTLFAAWLDKRTTVASRARGIEQPGAALAYAWSHDGGATFDTEKIAQDHTCECCHLGVAFDGSDRPVVLFRAIYGTNVRDHAVVAFGVDGSPGPAHRVAVDDWEINGCPHHGPGLAIAADGSYQAAWFTQGKAREGLFYARSTDDGKTFSDPQAVGNADQQAGRPQLFAKGDRVWLVWKEFDGKSVLVKARESKDAGRSWTSDRLVAQVHGYADHPALVADGHRLYVSWMTRESGYRLIPIDAL